ncbi:MAG: hypothetical protein ABW278_15065 [Steroidobacteraceae bacterium]
MSPQMDDEATARRRKLHATAWRLAAFAFVVYIGFIVAFINRH